jgi:predicted ABC-type sugar transport system permease subunit
MKIEMTEAPAATERRSRDWRQRIDVPVATAFGCIVLLLALGSVYSSNFLSPEYLLQQLKVGAFLGIIATGMMLVILLGQIDLSVPWVVAVGGMMATAATGWGPLGVMLAIPIGIACGVALGLVNGVGVAFLLAGMMSGGITVCGHAFVVSAPLIRIEGSAHIRTERARTTLLAFSADASFRLTGSGLRDQSPRTQYLDSICDCRW